MYKECFKYIQSDYYRYTGELANVSKLIFMAIIAKNHCFTYNFWLRLASLNGIIGILAKLKHLHISRKYGVYISPKCKIGYGFYIGHGVGVVINPKTIIGNNCNISQFLSIGSNKGTPAIIGDNVYIGPNVCLVENVHIGDNVSIGAGAVVVKDIPRNKTVVGCPAKVIGENKHPEFVHNRYTDSNI